VASPISFTYGQVNQHQSINNQPTNQSTDQSTINDLICVVADDHPFISFTIVVVMMPFQTPPSTTTYQSWTEKKISSVQSWEQNLLGPIASLRPPRTNGATD
jgi:hypothetical protein